MNVMDILNEISMFKQYIEKTVFLKINNLLYYGLYH